jgi:tetratricopeptide (TPR) repeat protein
MPPSIFIISLSGIIVVMARGMVRSRRSQFAQSVQSAGDTSPFRQPTDVLRPTQKSVQAIRSRAMLVGRWLNQSKKAAFGGAVFMRAKLRVFRQRGAYLSAWQQKMSATRLGLWQRVKNRLKRSPAPAFPEPNIDALFTQTPELVVTTRLVTTAPTAKPTPRRDGRAEPTKKMTALQRAQQALNAKDYQHAEGILVDHIIHHTKDTKAYMLLGKIALAKSDWPEAVEIFEQVLTLHPEEPGVQAGLGIAAYNCGRYSKALQTLQRAHAEDPTNRTVLTDLLAIAQKMDNPALQRSIKAKIKELASAARLPDGQEQTADQVVL